MKYRARKLCKTIQSQNPKANPYALLFAKLTGLKSPPKARQGYQQFMHENWQDIIGPECKRRWEKKLAEEGKHRDTIMPTAFRTAVSRDLFSKLPAEQQNAIKKRAQAEAQAAKQAYEDALNSDPPKTAEARQRAIDAIPSFVAPILQGLYEHTNLKFSLIYGGPAPKYNGDMFTDCVSWGRSLSNNPLSWDRWDDERFSDVMDFFREWLSVAFNDEDVKAAQGLVDPTQSNPRKKTSYTFNNNNDEEDDPSGFDPYGEYTVDSDADKPAPPPRKRPRIAEKTHKSPAPAKQAPPIDVFNSSVPTSPTSTSTTQSNSRLGAAPADPAPSPATPPTTLQRSPSPTPEHEQEWEMVQDLPEPQPQPIPNFSSAPLPLPPLPVPLSFQEPSEANSGRRSGLNDRVGASTGRLSFATWPTTVDESHPSKKLAPEDRQAEPPSKQDYARSTTHYSAPSTTVTRPSSNLRSTQNLHELSQ